MATPTAPTLTRSACTLDYMTQPIALHLVRGPHQESPGACHIRVPPLGLLIDAVLGLLQEVRNGTLLKDVQQSTAFKGAALGTECRPIERKCAGTGTSKSVWEAVTGFLCRAVTIGPSI